MAILLFVHAGPMDETPGGQGHIHGVCRNARRLEQFYPPTLQGRAHGCMIPFLWLASSALEEAEDARPFDRHLHSPAFMSRHDDSSRKSRKTLKVRCLAESQDEKIPTSKANGQPSSMPETLPE